MSLLDTFLRDEADLHVRQLILDAIDRHRTDGYTGIEKFEFNRFNVVLDFEKKLVTITDDLTIDPEGEYVVEIQEFETALLGTI